MNDRKYIAKLYSYTITRDNYNQGEDPDTTGYSEAPVKSIRFNTFKEFKQILGSHLDMNDFYILHNEDNRYDVQWAATDEDGIFSPSQEQWDKFQKDEIELYSCVMPIEVYRITPASRDEFEGQLD